MIFLRRFKRFRREVEDELKNSRLYPTQIWVLISITPVVVLLILVVEILTAYSVYRDWMSLWSFLQLSPLVQYFGVSLLFDLLVLLFVSLLPTLVVLSQKKCQHSATIFKESFVLLTIPSLVLLHVILVLLVLPQARGDFSFESSTALAQAVQSSIIIQLIGFYAMFYGLVDALRKMNDGTSER